MAGMRRILLGWRWRQRGGAKSGARVAQRRWEHQAVRGRGRGSTAPAAGENRVVFFGDSITDFWGGATESSSQ